MACNCATEQELNKLYSAYGEKIDNLNIKERIKYVPLKLFLYLSMIVVLPVILCYIIVHSITGKRIHVNNILGINGRNE